MPDLRPLGADQFGDYNDRAETRHSDPLALTQLLLTTACCHKYTDVQMLPFAAPVAALSRMQNSPVVT
jgi:phosphoribulokinase